MNELTKEQTGRLITFSRKLWKSLTQEEREAYYCDSGTIGFVEDVSRILHLNLCTTSLSHFETIHRSIFGPYTR